MAGQKIILHFGIDLAEQALNHVEFIKAVNNNKELSKPEVLKRAIYRYENFWLPLVAEHPKECLSAPMDIEWVWHCHMLSPRAYENDCSAVIGLTANHTIFRPDDFQTARNRAHAYWSDKYPEPFYIDYTASYNEDAVSNFNSQISYDIMSAAERQKSFCYQVSLPHYQDKKFLESALARYKQFLLLKRKHPDEFIVPCYDVDLIWHTHQLNPLLYKIETTRLLGQLFNHDDSVNERHEGSKLDTADKRTRFLWKQEYDESFSKFGAMFRGNPPNGKFYSLTPKDEFVISTKRCAVSLDMLTLNVPSPDLNKSKHLELKASSAKVSRDEVSKLFKLKRPTSSRPGNPTIAWSKIGSFNFDTIKEHGILFSIQQKSGMLGSKSEVDSSFLDLMPIIESPINSSKPGGLLKGKLKFKDNVALEIQGHYQQPKISDVFLFLIAGEYKTEQLPDDLMTLLGSTLPENFSSEEDGTCQMATHVLRNHLSKDIFKVCVIHSMSLMTSAIQVYYDDTLCCLAHLIVADQLPLPTQVTQYIVTLNPKRGERAVLIKNNDGDWGVVCGHWAGLRKGVPPMAGRRGIPGCPGTLKIKFYKIAPREIFECELPYMLRQYKLDVDSARIDLRTGVLHIDPQSNEVAEHVALVFSISLLHVLCVPRPNDWAEGRPVGIRTARGARAVEPIPSDSLAYVKAAGLIQNTPSNFYLASKYGSKFCHMCLGVNEEFGDIDKELNYFDEDEDIGGFDFSDADGGDGGGCGGCGGCGGGAGGGGAGDGGGGVGDGGGGDGGGCGSCGGCGG